MPANPERVQSVFLAAVGQDSPAARAAVLDRECGPDAELRARVETLLKAHDAPGPFLESRAPSLALTVDEPAAAERPGTLIGPYKLLEQIGEGGFGVVFLAEQNEPVRRKVALKVLKPGMDTRQVVARFEAERQALAIMDHPNIARVYDGGATPSGRPYFVMELVKGTPITEFCDQHHLTPRERLELFIPVCQAVQHAHQKGIIHRDLKPSNVLVSRHDSTPVVKVIDFGIAKALGQSLTDKTLFTGVAQMVGTPLYMSPEQAGMSDLDVDTRSDIYSLGVLLYELLTGTTPFTKERFKQAAYDEIRRIIREEEPPKPSTRLSESRDALPSVAAQRHTEPAKLTRLVRGELDWIVMKALEKDRSRRYETANGLAMDVQRYLSDEPVLACPPSVGYRLRKFARRNKGGLAVAALVLVFLVLLGGGAGWAVRDRAARESRIGAQADLILGEVERLEQEQKWAEALAAAQRAEALAAGGADAATRERVRRVLHDLEMVARLEEVRLQESPGAGPGAFLNEGRPRLYAAAFRDFGVDVEALPAEESAARLRARAGVTVALAAALDDWADAGLRRAPDRSKRIWALAAAVDPDPWRVGLRQAAAAADVESLMKLASAPDTARQPPQSQKLLASSLKLCDRPEQAIAVLERAGEIHPGDFWIHHNLGVINAHVRPARLAAAVRHATAARAIRPSSGVAWSRLGTVLKEQGKWDEAIACFRKAIELGPDYPSTHNNLGLCLRHRGKPEEAIACFRKAMELDPEVAAPHINLGVILADQKKWDEAIARYRKAIELEPEHPGAYVNLGATLTKQGKPAEAIAAYRKAIEVDPSFPLAHSNLGTALTNQGKPDEAISAFRRAIELDPSYAKAYAGLADALRHKDKLDGAIAAYHKAIELDPAEIGAHVNLGVALHRQKKPAEAIAAYRRALKLDPANASAHNNLGTILCDDLRDYENAAACFRKAIALDPNMASAHFNLGNALRAQKKLDEAVAAYRKAIEVDPSNAKAYGGLADALADKNKLDEAITAYRKAIELDPKFAMAHTNLGGALRNQGKPADAISAFRKAIEVDPNLPLAHYGLGTALKAQGKLDEAVACYRRAVELDPSRAIAHAGLADALRRQNKLDEAVAALRKAREAFRLKPDDAGARNALAEGLNKLAWDLGMHKEPARRDPGRAVRLAEEAVELKPQDGYIRNTLGAALYRAGDWKDAIEALERADRLLGGKFYSHNAFFIAMSHWQLGNKEEARTWYDRAVEWMGKNQPKDEDLRRFRAEAAGLLNVEKKKD